MGVPHLSARLVRRWLRPVVAAVLLLNAALASPAIATAHAFSAQVAGAAAATQHCPAHGQPPSGGTSSVPPSHSCCDGASCECSTASACLSFEDAPLGTEFALAPMIAEPARSATAQDRRTSLFRPPIR